MADTVANTAAPATSAPAPPPAVASPTVRNDVPVPPTTAAHGAPATPEAATGRLGRFQINDRYWQWKAGFRLFTILCAVIGLACLVSVGVDAEDGSGNDNYYREDSWVGALSIPLILSLIFNLIYLLFLFLSKRAIHPGVAVGVDLILWLSIIVTGLFAMYGYFSIRYWNDDYSSSYSDSYTDYYNESYCGSVDIVYNSYDGSCTAKTTDCPGWDSCEAKEASEKIDRRAKTMLAGVAFNWLCLILHFILFVWACVDTSRRNKMKVTQSAKDVAEKIVQEMVATGQLTRPAPTMLNDMRGQRQQPAEYYSPPAQREEV